MKTAAAVISTAVLGLLPERAGLLPVRARMPRGVAAGPADIDAASGAGFGGHRRELKQAPAGGMPIEELRERIARSRAD